MVQLSCPMGGRGTVALSGRGAVALNGGKVGQTWSAPSPIRPCLWSPPSSAFAGYRFPPDVTVVAVRWFRPLSTALASVCAVIPADCLPWTTSSSTAPIWPHVGSRDHVYVGQETTSRSSQQYCYACSPTTAQSYRPCRRLSSTAINNPLVVHVGQDGADEADDRGVIGEDTYDPGLAA